MARNGGAVIDTQRSCVRDRNGVSYPLDVLFVGADGLYYGRPTPGDQLFSYQERWVLPRQAWVINRFAFHLHRTDAVDWYIETDLTDVSAHLWSVRDGYLDVSVHDGLRYDVEDAGELADAITEGDIPLGDAIEALRSFDRLCAALRVNGCSGHALLNEFAPSLPASMLVRSAEGVFSHRV